MTLQEPLFTPLDISFLSSDAEYGYQIVENPEAFKLINERSLVYAIHCYADVYKGISEGLKPAVIVGTEVELFSGL